MSVRPVIHNDYASLAHRKGLPPGHAAVKREMVVPILRDGRIVAIIGVGNKPTDYNATDVEIALSLGQLSWEIFERIRAVDELQTAHAEVEHRTQELAATNKELEAFSYSVSHDLRAPLHRIIGFADILLERYADKLDDKGKKHLDRVINGAEKMNRIIDDMLHLSQISRHEVQRQKVDMSKIAASVMTELREAQPDRMCHCRYQRRHYGVCRRKVDRGRAFESARQCMEVYLKDGTCPHRIRNDRAGRKDRLLCKGQWGRLRSNII